MNMFVSLTCGPDYNQRTEERSLSIRKIRSLVNSTPTYRNYATVPVKAWVNATGSTNLSKFNFLDN